MRVTRAAGVAGCTATTVASSWVFQRGSSGPSVYLVKRLPAFLAGYLLSEVVESSAGHVTIGASGSLFVCGIERG